MVAYWLHCNVYLVRVLLIVYNSTEHVTWKSPGAMCGWVGRLLHPGSCISSWSEVPLLSIWFVAVFLYWPYLPCSSQWHGSLAQHGLWWLTLLSLALDWRLGLCTSCDEIHFFVLFNPRTDLPAYLPSIWTRAVLARTACHCMTTSRPHTDESENKPSHAPRGIFMLDVFRS